MIQTIAIKTTSVGRKVIVELVFFQLERLASHLGFYNPGFLQSLDRAEQDYKAGRVRKVASLRELRKRK